VLFCVSAENSTFIADNQTIPWSHNNNNNSDADPYDNVWLKRARREANNSDIDLFMYGIDDPDQVIVVAVVLCA
jgi:hypothetical protein